MLRQIRFPRVVLLALWLGAACVNHVFASEDTAELPAPVIEGQRVTLFADIGAGQPPFTYQWKKNDTPIPGATDFALTFEPVRVDDTGSYTVVVSNSAGSATSVPANVLVKPTPSRI